MSRTKIRPLSQMGGYAVDPRQSVWRTVALVALGWGVAAGTTGVAYLSLGMEVIPIMVGVVLCFAFVMFLGLLHRAVWLAFLAFGPALFVLVGAVQYAPESTLEQRGIRESVVIVADTAEAESTDNHKFTLRRADGSEVEEKLGYDGDAWAPEVGDKLDIIRDPEGEIPMDQADSVDAGGRMEGLIGGTVAWTLMALLAGRRGHIRRRKGLDSTLAQFL
ncbi:hypothetical protein [Streptomyces sp. NPDC000410]|uniref:hypothetical protein n=1 Tax=Streptomyces sp. NPDC000410 TaxID=3154254 RepID=UPI0033258C1C